MKIIWIFSFAFFLFFNLCAQSQIKINIKKQKTPISKYVYGQFIEHLGRCIYGGLWAEMLEDRKFYYPITDNNNPYGTATDSYWGAGEFKYLNGSPWRIIGKKEIVKMDSANPYVGKYTPEVFLPGDGTFAGISQDGLAVLKGRNYEGRIILSGDGKASPVIVRLVIDDKTILEQKISGFSPDFKIYPLKYTAQKSSNNVKIEIISKGSGKFRIGTLSLMPADNIKGWRKDVLKLIKDLDAPVYRWPGGNFVSGYDWKDGIGPRDKRPPRKNPAWTGIEHNDVGIHEYMELMELIKSEPFISVNTGLGTVEEVTKEVEYCNSPESSTMGKLRSKNGHPEPYNIKLWAVGNEMYGSWQLGHMPLKEYVKKDNLIGQAMWNVDKNINLVGVGSVGEWSETMLKVCSDYMNYMSEHIYCKELPDVKDHTKQLANDIKRVADAHRKYRQEFSEIKGKDIRIAMDEWNYWYGNYIYGELGVRYHHKDAMGVARGLHEFFRNSDLYFMANYAQTVNVIGCIKTTPTHSEFETTGLSLKLYRNNFGTIPVEISGEDGDLDFSAALTTDKKAVTVAVVNPTDKQEDRSIDFCKSGIKEKCRKWIIMNSNPNSYNEPGKTPNITIKEEKSVIKDGKISIPPYSVVMYRFDIKY